MKEQELRVLLTRATEDVPASVRLMPALRAPRRRRARVLVPAIAGLGVAAVVSTAVLSLPSNQPFAQAAMIAAVEATSQSSFRFHETIGNRKWEGAVDPVRQVGVITNAAEGDETRFVGDKMYSRNPEAGTWSAYPRPEVELANASPAVAVIKLGALNPDQALGRLRSATDVKESGPASGTGWTGKRFAFSLSDSVPAASEGKDTDLEGVVDVDDQGRVRRLEIIFEDGHRIVTEFSDFGTPVEVEAPPADQIRQEPSVKGDKGSAGKGKEGDSPADVKRAEAP
ncbi:hypothetical protein ABZ912_49440 [Nonomuraea angiospora]|uniref:hypothetical protein n=1 Tax=Nonomuraea angiospora TaxID=46172 RepID=UPI0033CE81BB